MFGDSLSDQGNAYEMTGDLFPPPPYDQRASNGPTAVEYQAQQLGLPLAPGALGGTHYAVVGATTGPVTIPGTTTVTENFAAITYGLPALEGTSILTQVGTFLGGGQPVDPIRSSVCGASSTQSRASVIAAHEREIAAKTSNTVRRSHWR